MRTLLLTVTLAAVAAPALATPIKDVTPATPACYGREYSEGHMAMPEHSNQTVKRLLVKFFKNENSGDGIFLQLEAKVKRPAGHDDNGKPFTQLVSYEQSFWCIENGGKLSCGIDCDGGRATVDLRVKKDGDTITFKNEGFVVVGGCGEETQQNLLWLDPKKGGDDKFILYSIRSEICQP